MAITDEQILKIFDNESDATSLQAALHQVLDQCRGVDICVGYLHLRGWNIISGLVDRLEGKDTDQARVLVGMHADPITEMEAAASIRPARPTPDPPTRKKLRQEILDHFHHQLTFGLPSNTYEATLRHMAAQLRLGKVALRLYTRQRLHAKLYLIRRNDVVYPRYGIVGSSNLTAPGLWKQGELNVAVHDQQDCKQLQQWFDKRWNDEFTFEITDLIETMIRTGWAREDIRPFLVYLRMAYHVATDGLEARKEFPIPAPFDKELFPFQKEAVQLAAHKLLREGGFEGVLLADVVGLGKTFMASAVLKIFQQDRDERALILCPKNLIPMWEGFVGSYNLNARVVSVSNPKKFKDLPGRYGCVVIDESHNLRNRETKTWRELYDFIESNKARVILLTATPMNKNYSDLSSQLRLFVSPDSDLGVRPNKHIRDLQNAGKALPQYPTALSAFEQSIHSEDWRELMRLFMVRRTRQYLIERGYAAYDQEKDRYFIRDAKDVRRFFPLRVPRKVDFHCDDNDPNDQYARLYSQTVVNTILNLDLPRYGLGNHVDPKADVEDRHKAIVKDLGRSGRRLIGYCRMNLFKRLESSGHSFLLSIERHILRNLIFAYALQNGLDLPIGTQDPSLLDPGLADIDSTADLEEDDQTEESLDDIREAEAESFREFEAKAKSAYDRYRKHGQNLFRWLPSSYFLSRLQKQLIADAKALVEVLAMAGDWRAARDQNLNELEKLLTKSHPKEKVIVFTQFADTALYLGDQLQKRLVKDVGVVTGGTSNPTELAKRFSPKSNHAAVDEKDELRILIATDVLSEGQNLQDAHVVVNYDLPWAIIRLIQRAGRVDRIGQDNLSVYCYSFLPQQGVERIIRLRTRLVQRLQASGEVLGTDEQFLDETVNMDRDLRRLYAEDPDLLKDKDAEVDLASEAMRIWENASEEDREAALNLQTNSYATKVNVDSGDNTRESGALVFARYGPSRFAVSRVGKDGTVLTESLSEVLKAAQCLPHESPRPRHKDHHDLVKKALETIAKERRSGVGRLGSPREPRRKVFDR
ncbi:MAG: hypothetical protein QOJ65_2418, partial [Fimbriimonadaceae bacterium]|nr:hypothetical protein [Fimbriimonadaceae bacterium]